MMRKLISGDKVKDAIEEVKDIQKELKNFPPGYVVWDIDDLDKQPPWGEKISDEITDLSNYFVISDEENLITILIHALEKAEEMDLPIEIESI